MEYIKNIFQCKEKGHLLNSLFIFLGCFFVAFLFLISLHHSFFWDTIQLGSLHAHYYSSTLFSNFLLPDSMDSGHIPAFGMYLSLFWIFLGRSLWISHMAMLPFVIGILWQIYQLSKHFIEPKYRGLAFFMVLIDPTLSAQMILVSPDVPLMFFFLWSINHILYNNKKGLSICIAFLFLISMRGMMISFCLLLMDVIKNVFSKKQTWKEYFFLLLKRSEIYLPALFIFVTYNYFHYLEKGWIGFHNDSPWAEHFEKTDLKGFIYNIGILGWRMLDFGKVGIWLIFFFLIIKNRNRIFSLFPKGSKLNLLLFSFLIFATLLPLNMLWAKSLLNPRYLLPIYILFALFVATLLFSKNVVKEKTRIFLVGFWMIILLTGNFWIYPPKVSQGWDSSLAHIPYYSLRTEALRYLDQQAIPLEEVASFFPNQGSLDHTDLSGDPRKFSVFDNQVPYALYSNVFNISDEEYQTLQNQYTIIKEFREGRIYFRLYHKTPTPQ